MSKKAIKEKKPVVLKFEPQTEQWWGTVAGKRRSFNNESVHVFRATFPASKLEAGADGVIRWLCFFEAPAQNLFTV